MRNNTGLKLRFFLARKKRFGVCRRKVRHFPMFRLMLEGMGVMVATSFAMESPQTFSNYYGMLYDTLEQFGWPYVKVVAPWELITLVLLAIVLANVCILAIVLVFYWCFKGIFKCSIALRNKHSLEDAPITSTRVGGRPAISIFPTDTSRDDHGGVISLTCGEKLKYKVFSVLGILAILGHISRLLIWFTTIVVWLGTLLLSMFGTVNVYVGIILQIILLCSVWILMIKVPKSMEDDDDDAHHLTRAFTIGSTLRDSTTNTEQIWIVSAWHWFVKLPPVDYSIRLIAYRRRRAFLGVVVIVIFCCCLGSLTAAYCSDCTTSSCDVSYSLAQWTDLFPNTQFKRSFLVSPFCSFGEPCHVYFTVGSDMRTSIIVNYQTYQPSTIGARLLTQVCYDNVSHASDLQPSSYAICVTGNTAVTPVLSSYNSEDNRYLHSLLVTGLSTNTTYYFLVGSDSNGIGYALTEFKIRTAPHSGVVNLIAGGALGIVADLNDWLTASSSYEPYAFLFSGGLAYDHGYTPCYQKWDTWLEVYQKNAITPQGYTVPFIASLGESEASTTTEAKKSTQLPFYLLYFNQQDHQPSSWLSRDTYHSHILNDDTVVIALDSGISSHIDGDQKDWLEQRLTRFTSFKYKIVIYNQPIFPATKSAAIDSLASLYTNIYTEYTTFVTGIDKVKLMKENWLPLFYEYDVAVAIEGSSQALKMTNIMANGTRSTTGEGTVFLGDGCMGMPSVATSLLEETSSDLAFVGGNRHFWQLSILAASIGNVTVTARNVQKDAFVAQTWQK